jgi:hypothetical protein
MEANGHDANAAHTTQTYHHKIRVCACPILSIVQNRAWLSCVIHASGGELEQIQFLLGHVGLQMTERYLGCKQRFRSAVNDRIGIEPSS